MTEPKKRPIVLWDVARLKPYPKNAKKHSPEDQAKLAASIKRFGLANPPNVKPDGEIITGHGRWMAVAQILGWKKIPVDIRDDLTDAEADALRISDNQTASTDYDTELLKEGIMELSDSGFDDMTSLGFDDKELERMTSDFADMSGADDVFVEDISTAVEAQKEKNSAKEAEVDKSAAPVSDALGFKRVSVEQSREIREVMTLLESHYGSQGPTTLLSALRDARDYRIASEAKVLA